VNTPKRRLVLAGFVSLALLASACGEDEGAVEQTSAPTTEAPDTSEGGETETTMATETTEAMEMVGGEVFVTGSSTVEPISVRVGELAGEMSGGALAVSVEGPGTGDGFQKFCAGEADISDASRPIKDEEAAICAEAGIEFVEIEVAIDGLTVATSPNNTAVECLDVPALYALIGPESEGFTNWSDANDPRR
jgi:phosphate transport system substrate-binding protein